MNSVPKVGIYVNRSTEIFHDVYWPHMIVAMVTHGVSPHWFGPPRHVDHRLTATAAWFVNRR